MVRHEIPFDAPGIPWDVWYEQQIDRIFAQACESRARLKSQASTQPENTTHSARAAAATGRDNDRLLTFSPYNER